MRTIDRATQACHKRTGGFRRQLEIGVRTVEHLVAHNILLTGMVGTRHRVAGDQLAGHKRQLTGQCQQASRVVVVEHPIGNLPFAAEIIVGRVL